jgi:competence protein ComEC
LIVPGHTVRRTAELHWPALVVASACLGIAAATVAPTRAWLGPALALVGVVALGLLDGPQRVVGLAVALAGAGMWWGSLRLDALAESPLRDEVGTSASAEVVVTGPARRTSWAIRVPAEVRRFGSRRVRERVLLALPVGRSPPRGAILDAVVRVTEPRLAEGGFDEREWLARQGIHVVLRASSWRQIGRRGGVAGLGDRLRDRVEAVVDRGTSGVRRALVLGVVLGEDEGLPQQVRDDFRASGLAHLLAVSGQNVAYIAIGILGLGWLIRLTRVVRELAVLGAIGGYVLAVGWQPSVVRAGVAGALASLAWLLARPRDRWYCLAAGALVLLAWSPASYLEPGFQLSFVAVAAIFLGLPRIERRFRGSIVPRGILDAVGISTVCGFATAPIVLFHFGSAPVYTVPANALAAPAMPLVLGLGLLAAAVDPVTPTAGAALASLAGWAAAWLELVARTVASLPGAQVGSREAAGIAAAGAGLYATRRLIGARLRGRAPAVAVAAGGLVLVLLAGAWSRHGATAWERPPGLRVTFLDVGQGDAALLETASARVLVDEGPPEANVASQLARMGIRSLSAVVLTHPQRDHVGGAADVLRQLRVGVVLDPFLAATGPDREEAAAEARAHRIPIRPVRGGSVYRAGGLVLRVLSPPDAGSASEDPNLNATVLVASYGETDVFLPADAESDVTARLPVGAVEVLKVAHHGSEDPGLDEQLRELRPRIAVISVGRGNEYGHPRAETLAALAAVPGIAVYRTDRDGRVVVESDGRSLSVRTSP